MRRLIVVFGCLLALAAPAFAQPIPLPAPNQTAINWACATWPNYFPGGSCTLAYWNTLPYYMQYDALLVNGLIVKAPAPAPTTAPTGSCAIPSVEPAQSFIALGDSITYGTGSTIAYPSFAPLWGATAVNHGVSGDGSAEMLARLPSILAASPPLVVIHCCTNDVQRGLAPSTTVANLGQMVSLIRGAGKTPVLVAPLPRNNVSTAALLAQTDAIETYAHGACVRLLDFWFAFVHPTAPGTMAPRTTHDGVHPNTYGAYVFMRRLACGLGWWCGD
jgi:lysophospholipase L1-like esterase